MSLNKLDLYRSRKETGLKIILFTVLIKVPIAIYI